MGRNQPLALDGGHPVRRDLLPYAHQSVDDQDVEAVVQVLRSDWLTTGPKVAEFENACAAFAGARHGVAFSSGTAALHGAVYAAGLKPGDEAIVPPLTFCATANCVLYQGARPVFADVSLDTLNLDPEQAAAALSPRTRAILPVDYAGHPADLQRLGELAAKHRLTLIEDACHAFGALYQGQRVGGIAHMTVLSFHPVKHVATGEGGMVLTNDETMAARLRRFRSHGIDSDARLRSARGQHFYEMVDLGFNYRLSDIACALGLSQLRKLEANLARRRAIAAAYDEAFRALPQVTIPSVRGDVTPAWHLYPVRLVRAKLSVGRDQVFRALRAENIGVNVHYIPVHLHPYYRRTFGYKPGDFPVAEDAYASLLSLPMFHAMTDCDVQDVIRAVVKVLSHYAA